MNTDYNKISEQEIKDFLTLKWGWIFNNNSIIGKKNTNRQIQFHQLDIIERLEEGICIKNNGINIMHIFYDEDIVCFIPGSKSEIVVLDDVVKLYNRVEYSNFIEINITEDLG